jgi:hypothetical protein
MSGLEFRYYDTLADYKMYGYKGVRFQTNFRVNLYTIRRCAVVVGKTAWAAKEPTELSKWRLGLINAFIEILPTREIKIKNTEYLEQSEKNAVGYMFGMIYAQVFAQCVLGIRQTMHLKSTEVNVITKGKWPDLCGYNRPKNRAYLLEAKGSTVEGPKMDQQSTIEKACNQLNEVTEIEFTHINVKFKGNSLTKLAIGTHPNKVGEVELEVVDPVNVNKDSVTINSNLMVLKHYFHIYSLIKKFSGHSIKDTSSNYKIVYLKEEDFYIGMLKDIFVYLEPIYEKVSGDIIKLINETLGEYQDIYLDIEAILDTWELFKRPIFIGDILYFHNTKGEKYLEISKDDSNEKEADEENKIKIYEDIYNNVSIGIDGTIAYLNLDELKRSISLN